MPGKIKVKVLAGRNLPVMDRASDTTDAFVEIKFGNVTHKTDVCRKSLNPHWSSTEWYRFEVDESELQDEPLQLRLMDHDTYSANDAIGKVVISLAPLLAREANNVKGTGPPGGAVLSGWIPVFDTMHGIRGELNLIVKVELFTDFNKYKTSSCGVQFFHCPMIPPGYRATSIHGFVEELVVNDDPEYQWIDKIRTPRASNEARQEAFIKLSNQVQRLVGLKAGELGANAVLGYQQEFDLEGEAGVVARAIGTAVSITPLPTPSQPVNTVSCTQQQLQKCLDILATDDESVTDLSQYYKTHKDELQKMINLLNPKGLSMLDSQENDNDDDEKVELVRQSSLNSYAGSASLYQDEYVSRNSLRHLSEDQTDLNRLLNRKDDDDSDSSGPIQKIKQLKTNFFTKRFTKRKGHKKDAKADDSISLRSNSSDTSRISLYDIKNEFKKLKRMKKPKFIKTANKEDEGEGMASILARSVIHARTSLACIAETQDSQAENSPCSTMTRTSESKPNVHIDDDKSNINAEREKEDQNKVPDIQLKHNSLEDLPNLEPRVRRISESCPASPTPERGDNLLKLPGDKDYFGSVSSAQSGESSIYSSSEDDDESSDLKTDTDEFETTTSIVKSVTRHETDPALIAQMDRKLTVLQNTPPKISEKVLEEFNKRTGRSMDVALDQIQASRSLEKAANGFECKIEKADEIEKVEPVVTEVVTEPSTSTKDDKKCVSKPNTHYIKIHNPFASRKPSTSISCPSSPVERHNFVYRSSKRIKDKLSKFSKNNMIKSISHISLFPKKKEQTLSQPGSTSDVPSYPSKCPSETVLGSHFLSYSDLLELDKDRMQENKLCKSDEIGRTKFSMYIGSEPVSRCSISGPSHPHSRDEHDHRKERNSLKPTGLIHTAMETMLIEKVESLLIPTSPEQAVNTKFFDDVSERLEEHKNSGDVMHQLQSTTGSITPRIVAVTPKRLSEDLTADIDKVFNKHLEETKGLVHTEIESKLVDKGRVILPDTDGIINESFHEHYDSELYKDMHRKKDSRGSISTLMDKVHFHPHLFQKKDGSSHDIRSGGLIHTAMQTILIDRAQSMIPDTPEPIPIHTEPDFGEIGKHHKLHCKEKESTGLVHSALQTMLIDNVQTVLADSNEPIPIRLADEDTKSLKSHENDKESTGLVHTALQTMLIENVQTVLPETNEPIPIQIDDDGESQKNHRKEKESTGLVHSALQTMLIDNVQTVLADSEKPIPIRVDDEDTKSQKSHGKDKESTGLIHTALQTMLIENVQSVLPDSTEPIPIRIKNDDTKSQTSHGKEKESTGLVHTALETMLFENIQPVLPDTDNTIPTKIDNDNTTSQFAHDSNEEKSKGLVYNAMESILIDRIQSIFPKDTVELIIHDTDTELKSTSLVKNAMQTIEVQEAKNKISKTNTDISNPDLSGISNKTIVDVQSNKADHAYKGEHSQVKSKDINVKSWSENSATDPSELTKDFKDTLFKEEIAKNKKKEEQIKAFEERKKHFTRQDSVHSITSTKMSNEPNTHKTRALLQNFHPLQSGLETIPSVEDSFDRSIDNTNCSSDNLDSNISVESIDETNVSGVNTPSGNDTFQAELSEDNKSSIKDHDASNNSDSRKFIKPVAKNVDSDTLSGDRTTHRDGIETNSTSVCDNSHAACRFDRERERDRDRDRSEKGSPKHARHESCGGREPPAQNSSLNASSTPMGIHRRSSDSDLSVTPKGGSLNTSVGNTVASGGGAILRPSMNSNNLDMLEYPFLTMTEYPTGFIVHIGGAVCARSVKLVDGGGESAARAAWWTELRTELRAHARALRCNAVIAYRDSAAICEDVCVLSASGTAVVINLDCDFNADIDAPITVNGSSKAADEADDSCSMAHVPYSPGVGPNRAELSTCGECRRARVPAVLLAACAKPNNLTAYPKSVTLTAVAARIRRAPPTAEPAARDISDQLPFLEYELHKLLLAKLRMQGANALFSLQTQIAIGERCVMALASGTAVKLPALPPPTPPRIKASEKEKDALEMQKALWDAFTANKAANGYDVVAGVYDATNQALPETEREERPVLDLCSDKDACVLELDEAEDVETARALSKRRVQMPAFTNSVQVAPAAQPLAFTQVSRCRLVLSSGSGASAAAERQVSRALDGAAYKLRRMAPAALNAAFQLDLPEDEIQLVVSGTAIPLVDPTKHEHSESLHSQNSHNGQQSSHNSQSSQTSQTENDDIFELDEEQMKPAPSAQEVEDKVPTGQQVSSAVSLTTLSSVCGRSAVRLCALRLLFVRETTAVRELGGLSGFLHTFTCEVLAILRAYTAALGGNALTSFYITQLMLQDNAHKNQGQCLLSVGGDVVYVSY